MIKNEKNQIEKNLKNEIHNLSKTIKDNENTILHKEKWDNELLSQLSNTEMKDDIQKL